MKSIAGNVLDNTVEIIKKDLSRVTTKIGVILPSTQVRMVMKTSPPNVDGLPEYLDNFVQNKNKYTSLNNNKQQNITSIKKVERYHVS
jgi:hypothetical protein